MAQQHDGARYKCVWATHIDDTAVAFPCWYCYDRYRRDGRPTKTAVPVVHRYPSNGDRSRGERFVWPTCAPRGAAAPVGFPDTEYAGFCVVVDDTTAGSVPA